jgi:CRP-like cAMP-binding protein
MHTLSNQIIVFKQKIEILHQKDVRSRLILYLSLLYEKKCTPFFYLPHRKTEIASLIGVARPSVSREFSNMETDGLIKLEGTYITLLHPSLFTPLKTQ